MVPARGEGAREAARRSVHGLKVELRTQAGTVATVALVGGSARGSNAKSQAFLDSLVVVEPGSLVRLTAEDGERFLRALPPSLSGTYLWAVMLND